MRAGGVTVLAISIDGTGVQAAKPVIDEGRFGFVVPIDQTMTVARQFGVRGVPTTFVVDRRGNVVAQGFGPIDLDGAEFRAFVEAVAAQS